ncbi:MAG TPA: hypothetical protein VIL11_07485 [Limnochordales bacterium]
MAEGTFRRLVRDEEICREEYLDRQLELGWEETPADGLPERAQPAELPAAAEELDAPMPPLRSVLRPLRQRVGGRQGSRASRGLSRAARTARHTSSRS